MITRKKTIAIKPVMKGGVPPFSPLFFLIIFELSFKPVESVTICGEIQAGNGADMTIQDNQRPEKGKRVCEQFIHKLLSNSKKINK